MTDLRSNGTHLPQKIRRDNNAVVINVIMSQQPNSVLSGPSPDNIVPFKDVQPQQDMTKNQEHNGNSSVPQPPSLPSGPPRPILNRIDSRGSFPIRPGFPPNQPLRSPQIRQGPPLAGQPPYIYRPSLGPRPSSGQPFPPNQAQRPIHPNFRPPTPFPRPQIIQQGGARPPGIFQQRLVPTFGQQRPQNFEGDSFRSRMLEATTEHSFQQKPLHDNGDGRIYDDARSAMKTRSISINDPHYPQQPLLQHDEERRRSISSVGSVDEKRSLSGSIENLVDRRSDNDYPSRPESRASAKMNRIMEDDVVKPVKSPSSHVDFNIPPAEIVNKSPSPINMSKSPVPPPPQNHTNIESGVVNEQRNIVQPNNLELKDLTKTPSRAEGDNDSGVDESTQGNDQSSNGDHNSPRKSSTGKTTNRTTSTTPTKNRSLSRGSKSPSLKSPTSTASTPGTTEKKKLPMNKVQVGSAPSPNLKVVKSKIGSLENATYKPGGGNVKIENKKLDFKNAAPRIAAKNDRYVPKGGEKKIQQQKLQWNAKSKIGSFENTTHKPKGGDKKIESVKLDFKEKAKSKVGSKDNMKYVPGGGDIKIENKKLDIKVQSKVGSLAYIKHKPGGGDKKIFDDKDYLKQRSAISSENQSLSGSQSLQDFLTIKNQRPQTERAKRSAAITEDESTSRRTPRLTRSKSARMKKSSSNPQPPWRF